jgi:hypothetical protein
MEKKASAGATGSGSAKTADASRKTAERTHRSARHRIDVEARDNRAFE